MFKRLLFATLAYFTIANTNAAPINIDDGCTSIINNNQTYLFCKNNQNWSNAQTFCTMSGGDLISIKNAEESEWVMQKRNETDTLNTPMWINFKKNLVFLDGNIMSSSGLQNINCAKVLAFSSNIENMLCDVFLNFICEIPYVPTVTTSAYTPSAYTTSAYTTSTTELPYYERSDFYQPFFIFFGALIIILIIIRVQMRNTYVYNRRVNYIPADTEATMSPPFQLIENFYVKPVYAYAKPAYMEVKPTVEAVPAYSVPTDAVPSYIEITTDTGNYAYLTANTLLPEAYLPEAYLPEDYLPEDIHETHTYMR